MRLFPKLILSSVSILLASVHLSAQNGVSSLPANLSSSYSYVLSRIMTNASGTASLDHVDYDNGLGQTYQKVDVAITPGGSSDLGPAKGLSPGILAS